LAPAEPSGRKALISALVASQLAMLLGEERRQRVADDSHPRGLELCRRLTILRVNELVASQEARSSVEARYLEGHAALFPDIAAVFEEQLHQSQEIAVMAWRAAELDGVEPAEPEDPVALKAQAGELVADLVEPAKAEALDKLGEGWQALDIAAGWVRGKVS
jgi:hypothetical protein